MNDATLLNLETSLINAVSHQNIPTSKQLLNQLLLHLFNHEDYTLNYQKLRSIELITLISRAAKPYRHEQEDFFIQHDRALENILSLSDVDALYHCLSTCIHQLFDTIDDQQNMSYTIKTALQYIHDHLHDDIRIQTVAKAVYLSPSYFSKCFKKAIGLSFSAYVNKTKITKSIELLSRLDMSLSDIAYQLAYCDQSYFAKVFKQHTGHSPQDYRQDLIVK